MSWDASATGHMGVAVTIGILLIACTIMGERNKKKRGMYRTIFLVVALLIWGLSIMVQSKLI
jgi:hypothetical protein